MITYNVILGYIVFNLIRIAMQIIMVSQLSNQDINKYSKGWFRFLGITIAIFLTDLIAYLIYVYGSHDGMDIGLALFFWIAVAGSFIGNLTMLIVGLAVKSKKRRGVILNSKTIFTFIGTILITMITIAVVVVVALLSNPETNNIAKRNTVLNYLNEKYGQNSYNVMDIKNNYEMSSWTYHYKGYKATVRSETTGSVYYVNVSSNGDISESKVTIEEHEQSVKKEKEQLESFTNQMNSHISTENYYESKVRNALTRNKYNLRNMSVSVNLDPLKTINTNGEIPTLDELSKNNLLEYIFIKDLNFEATTENEQTEYVKNLAVVMADLLVNDLKISKNTKLSVHFMGEVKAPTFHTVEYYIEIENNILTITKGKYSKTPIAQCNLDYFRNMGK